MYFYFIFYFCLGHPYWGSKNSLIFNFESRFLFRKQDLNFTLSTEKTEVTVQFIANLSLLITE